MKIKHDELVYSKNVIEFVTVANEFCLFSENALEYEKTDFIDRTLKMLSLLYLKTSLLQQTDYINQDGNEKFVTEFDWLLIKNNISTLLEDDDLYLDFFDSNMEETAEPVSCSISENIADIYQDLKDFISVYRLNIPDLMNDALAECIDNFGQIWGYRLVNTLKILHLLKNKKNDGKSSFLTNDTTERSSQPENLFKKRG